MPPATTTRKRKQTDDMDDLSPPKRVTRARAAKATEEPAKVTKTTKPTKITTASARAAAKAKAMPTKSARATVNKTSTKDTKEEHEAEIQENGEATVKPTKTRGRPKKEEAVTTESSSAKTTRARATRATSAIATSTKTSKATRTQKANQTDEEGQVEAEDEQEETDKTVELAEPKPAPTRKTTRGRAAAATKKPEPAAAKKTTSKKKVAFKDDPAVDKENIIAPTVTKEKKQAEKMTGLAAKPVRKPAVATRSTRSRKEPIGKAEDRAETKSQPLSPKKPTQVAKSSSSDSEDELCTASPVRALSKSPVKPPMSIHKSPMKPSSQRADDAASAALSPAKSLGISVLASPAKRPQQSPFKGAIKESPRKLGIPNAFAAASFEALPAPSFQDSLRASPKRVQLNHQASQSAPSPFKQTLLQSPARRPNSPVKSNMFASPSKSKLGDVALGAGLFELPKMTPLKAPPPAMNGDASPEPSIKSHTMTPAEQADIRSKEPSPSPIRQGASKLDLDLLDEPEMPSGIPESLETSPAVRLFPSYRSSAYDSDSEDELQSGELTMMSPSRNHGVSVKDFALGTPMSLFPSSKQTSELDEKPVEALSMTPLALQLSTWCASSPEKQDSGAVEKASEGISTPSGPILFALPDQANKFVQRSPEKESQFEDQMFGHDQETVAVLEDEDLHDNEASATTAIEDVEMMDVDITTIEHDETEKELLITDSQTSEQYGDENTAPVDPLLVFAPVSQTNQRSAVSVEPTVVTPEQAPRLRQREIHTVSKVPLRAGSEDQSPIKIPRKRSKSTSGPLAEISDDSRPILPLSNAFISHSLGNVIEEEIAERATPSRKVSFETQVINQMMTPVKNGTGIQVSPLKSVRKGADAQILRGAVIHVDVHTSEGADASSIFIELLTSMGARCVKQWSWNPQASSSGTQPNTPSSKIGITHVVFKDGGKRTLQKVREAKGLVLCVGVSWVLDCERENRWLDEATYAVDTSTIPRGGHNRRKSMEPTRFSNVNGNLVKAGTEQQTPARIVVQSPTKEFLSFSAESRRSSIRPLPSPEDDVEEDLQQQQQQQEVPATPSPENEFNFDYLDDQTNFGSPTTPYFLGKGAQLVQMTCPPKQKMQSLFPISGRIEDQPDEAVRRRLVEARRKSLQWAPKIGSPLGRAVIGRDH